MNPKTFKLRPTYPVEIGHHAIGTTRAWHPVQARSVRAIVARRAIVVAGSWVARRDVFGQTEEAVGADLTLPHSCDNGQIYRWISRFISGTILGVRYNEKRGDLPKKAFWRHVSA